MTDNDSVGEREDRLFHGVLERQPLPLEEDSFRNSLPPGHERTLHMKHPQVLSAGYFSGFVQFAGCRCYNVQRGSEPGGHLRS